MVHVKGSAITGGTHHGQINLPQPSGAHLRPAHRPVEPKPRGLDWSQLKPACRACGTRTSDLNRDDQCPACSPRQAPVPAPPAPRPRRAPRAPRTPRTRPVTSEDSADVYTGEWVRVGGVLRPATPANLRAARRAAAQYDRPIGPPLRSGRDRIPLDGPALAEAYLAGATLAELADQQGVSAPTIARALDDQGVVRRKQRITYDEDLIARVRMCYADEQLDQAQVAERLGITTKVVQTAMARGGIEPRESASARSQRGIGHPIKITPDLADQILARYTAGEAGPQIAKDYGISAASVYHLLTKHSIPRHGRRTPGLGHDGSIALKARIAALGVAPRDINQWALDVGLLDMPKPGLPSGVTVDAYEDAHPRAEAS